MLTRSLRHPRSRRARLAALASTITLTLATVSVVPASVATAAAALPATIDVDASADGGTITNNPGWYLNQSRSTYFGEGPVPAGALEELRTEFRIKVNRAFSSPSEYEANPSKELPYLTQLSSYSDRVLLCFNPWIGQSAQRYQEVLTASLMKYKTEFPKIEYIEPWNEPNHANGGGLTPQQYYPYYRAAYRAVNAVNAQLNPEVPLQVGGPVTAGFKTAFIEDFLDEFVADTDPAKRLDFVSYHDYSLQNPAAAATQKPLVRTMLTGRSLPDLPVIVSEYGVYPGSAGTSDENYDHRVQAAAMAAAGAYYLDSGMDMPMHWVVNHLTNDRKDIYVDGTDRARWPYGHVVRMQNMLKANRVTTTTTPEAKDGVGIGALGTADDSGIALMYWNYQGQNGTDTYDASLTVRNLPDQLTGKKIKMQVYVTDGLTNNYAANTAGGTLTVTEEKIIEPAATVQHTSSLDRNAVALLVLTPVSGDTGPHEVTPPASGVTASTDDGNVPTNTVDNNLSTRWSASGDGQWIRYDLGESHTVSHATIAVYRGNERRNQFELQVSADGSTWQTVWSGQSSGTTLAQETYDFPDVSARYVRYLGHMNNTNNWNALTEVDIFATSADPPTDPTPTDPNLTVAFIGDAGVNSRAKDVLNVIKNENTDLVIHNGDLGYSGGPAQWESQLNGILGADFPYVWDVGNHDIENGQWSDYQNRLKNRVARIPGMSCTGDLGVKSWCTYRGLWFLLSGVGTLGSGHDTYIRDNCTAANHVWKVVGWHKLQTAMQLGSKGNDTGWPVYEESRKCGAIITTAHEHTYARTRTLTSTQNQIVDASCGDANKLCVDPGRTFVFHSGLGGESIRTQDRCKPTTFPYGCKQEWAKAYTSDQGAKPGALFLVFNVDGDPNKGRGYFKNTSGEVVDEFTFATGGDGGTPPPDNRYEAEDAACQGIVESNHAGFSGTGFCDTNNATGVYVEWTVNATQAGEHTLTFGYANASTAQPDRPVDVSVNGTVVATGLEFPPTGLWTNWQAVTTTVNLAEGTNTIRITATGSAGTANIDYLDVAAG